MRVFGIVGIAAAAGLCNGRAIIEGYRGEMDPLGAVIIAALCILIGTLTVLTDWEPV